ncbi:hypothetical protein QC762_0044720 [Podospora pseudocomata]|uniref:Uncharacterized protein n=1 Tax=Podospora pseudocomata TaxID=2093779 RepID=A0ABR0GNU3_9PEZI|nr:hypothetical protein QC762_0044720 [Podospora pseudocomata]
MPTAARPIGRNPKISEAIETLRELFFQHPTLTIRCDSHHTLPGSHLEVLLIFRHQYKVRRTLSSQCPDGW